MIVRIIAEGSFEIGAGHQVRMGVLARALIAGGHTVTMRCRALRGSSHAWAWADLPLYLLGEGSTLEALLRSDPEPCDWYIVDHYGVSAPQLKTLSTHARVAVVDDVPGRQLPTISLVINQNLGVCENEYAVQALVGPRFAMIRPEFCRATRAPDSAILVMIGATDDRRISSDICAVLRERKWPVEVVTATEELFPEGVRVHRRLGADALAQLMARCRAGVLAASSSVYEALAVGMPFVAIETADNQARIAQGLRAGSLAPVVGFDGLGQIPELIERLPPSLERVVDGKGAERIVSAMEQA